jgi:hypothetical protein
MLKKSSGHWDGGAGRRDVASLSAKDRRKNKGNGGLEYLDCDCQLNGLRLRLSIGVSRDGAAKTKSNKAQRVGVAGKKNRDEQKA